MIFENKKIFALACILCAIPVLISVYPPMVDIPQHAAQIESLKLMLFNDDWAYGNIFTIKLFTPYLMAYVVAMIFSVPFGIVWSIKITVAVAMCFYVWAAARFCWKMGVPVAPCWIFLIIPFGFAYQWGFLSFIVAAPLGFVFLTDLLNLNEKNDLKTWFRIAIWLNLLFFSHILITAFFCLVAIFILARPWGGWHQWVKRTLPLLMIVPAATVWFINALKNVPEAVSRPPIWAISAERFYEILSSISSVETAPTGLFLGGACLIIPFLSGCRPRRNIIAWMPFVIYLMVMFFVPHFVFGNYYTYQRFGIFGLPFYFCGFEKTKSIESSKNINRLAIGLFLVSISVIGWNTLKSMIFNAEVIGYQEVMQSAEGKKRILGLIFDHDSHAYGAPLMLHMQAWYQAEHGGLADFNFSHFYVTPLHFKNAVSAGVNSGIEWYPQLFDWSRDKGWLYDYILVRHPQNMSEWMDYRTDGKMKLLAQSGEWQLYGKNIQGLEN